MEPLTDLNKINVDTDEIENDVTKQKNISLSILRLDKIHRDISGNKLFKLHYFLEKAIASSHKKVITFGGAYSNHLAATAAACRQNGLSSTGIIRGEGPLNLSHTLLFCKEQGMNLEFVSRKNYKEKNEEDFKNNLVRKYGEHILIPEGGFSEDGMHGASLITEVYKHKKFTHVCCAIGTATTFAGLINASSKDEKIIGFTVLKNAFDVDERIQFLLKDSSYKNYFLITDYHFDGYAKKNKELIFFMNSFYDQFKIPTDFVYTAKMMFGIFDLLKKNYFPAKSNILCIHTGGLQGNFSLPKNTLHF